MNVMAGSLAVIVAFMVATTGSTVLEYSKKALESLQHTDQDPVKHYARVMRPDVQVKFVRSRSSGKGFYLYPVPTSDLKQTPQFCIQMIGFQVGYEPIACNIVYFHVSVDKLNDVHSVQFILFVQLSPQDPSLQINIPVLAIPSAYASADGKQLQKWADAKKVGLISPFTSEILQEIFENKQITFRFEWLSKLLPLGVFQLKDYRGLGVVVSRPIVLQKSLLAEMLNVAENRPPQ